MKNPIYLFILAVLVVGLGAFVAVGKGGKNVTSPDTQNSTSTPQAPVTNTIKYTNTQYGFSFILPKSWEGYSVIFDEWGGDSPTDPIKQNSFKQVPNEHGPLISIRHPDWEYKSPRQDIPIMVFTLKQWSDLQADKFHIGAAPINPSEIGRNKTYVFALPARYNYSYLTGYQEVEDILRGHPLVTF